MSLAYERPCHVRAGDHSLYTYEYVGGRAQHIEQFTCEVLWLTPGKSEARVRVVRGNADYREGECFNVFTYRLKRAHRLADCDKGGLGATLADGVTAAND